MTRTVQTGPMTALIAQVLLIAGLAATVGLSGVALSPASWVVGVSCAVITNAALAGGLSRYRVDRLGPADWVTLARATLAVGVAALIGGSFDQPASVTLLVCSRRWRSCWTRSTDGSRDARGQRRRWARTSTLRSTRS